MSRPARSAVNNESLGLFLTWSLHLSRGLPHFLGHSESFLFVQTTWVLSVWWRIKYTGLIWLLHECREPIRNNQFMLWVNINPQRMSSSVLNDCCAFVYVLCEVIIVFNVTTRWVGYYSFNLFSRSRLLTEHNVRDRVCWCSHYESLCLTSGRMLHIIMLLA